MKFFVVFALIVAVASAASLSSDAEAEVLENSNDNIGVGPFNFLFSTSNGIQARAQGDVQDLGTENEGLEVAGEYEYVGKDGNVYKVTYTAGRNGFRPSGAHIPA